MNAALPHANEAEARALSTPAPPSGAPESRFAPSDRKAGDALAAARLHYPVRAALWTAALLGLLMLNLFPYAVTRWLAG